MKILGIVYQSKSHPDRISLALTVSETFEKGVTDSLITIIKEQGDLDWRPLITSYKEITIPNNNPIVASPAIKEITNESWLMKTIIINKDTALLDTVKKYLTKNEAMYIEDKLAHEHRTI